MEFELTKEQILEIYKEKNWLIFGPDLHRADVVAHEAQKELVKWLESKESVARPDRDMRFAIYRDDWQAILNHFGVKDEEDK